MMRTVRHTFDKRTVSRTLKYTCLACNKQRKKVFSSWYTLNPFNAHKTEQEIRDKIENELLGREQEFFSKDCTCQKCKEAA